MPKVTLTEASIRAFRPCKISGNIRSWKLRISGRACSSLTGQWPVSTCMSEDMGDISVEGLMR